MTSQKSSIFVLGIMVLGIVLYILVSTFTNSPLPTAETPSIITCAEQGLITDPVDSSKCISPIATTTSTPPVLVPTPKPSTLGKFDVSLSLATTQSLTFSDELKITLSTINDSRCAADVQCIWEGELAPVFSVTGGVFGTDIKTIVLGTARNTSTTVGTYTFTLVTATDGSATFIVSKKPVSQNNGTVSGSVTIGPICPVERIGEPCVIHPETYTSRNVVVYGPTESTKISETPLNPNGTYSLSLAPGNYWLQIAPAGIGPGEKKPVTVKSNETIALNFDIDSGIR